MITALTDAQQAPRLKGPAVPRDEMHHARHLRRHVCYKRDECGEVVKGREQMVSERFERHRQPWTSEELQKLKLLAGKGMALKAISKAMTRSEESIKDRAKLDGIGIAKLR